MKTGGGEVANILLVDDNPGDIRLIEEAFTDGQFHNSLHTFTDGEAALDFIHQNEGYEDASRPDLALIDFYLPNIDAEELLHEIKHHPDLEDVPVIILTGADEDYIKSQDLDDDADEDAVLQKPIDLDEFLHVVREFDGFKISILRMND